MSRERASGAVVGRGANGANSTWQFNVSGMVQLPLGVEASANFYGRQGFPILYNVQAITGHPDDPIPNLFENPILQIGSVGAYRLPDVFLLDLHLEKAFRVGSTVTVSPFSTASTWRTATPRSSAMGSSGRTMPEVKRRSRRIAISITPSNFSEAAFSAAAFESRFRPR